MRFVEDFIHGLPHLGAKYSGGWQNKKLAYERTSETCMICDSQRATETHHVVPIGSGGRQSSRQLETKMGSFTLYTPLVAVCPECHRKLHNKSLEIAWLWDDEGGHEQWHNGSLLAHVVPHSQSLLEIGRWVTSEGKEL